MSLECFLKQWKMRQNNLLYADLASFLFNCARKNAFFGVRAEILLFLGFMQKYYCPELLHSGYLDKIVSCAGPLLGHVKKYYFWGEIFTCFILIQNAFICMKMVHISTMANI